MKTLTRLVTGNCNVIILRVDFIYFSNEHSGLVGLNGSVHSLAGECRNIRELNKRPALPGTNDCLISDLRLVFWATVSLLLYNQNWSTGGRK